MKYILNLVAIALFIVLIAIAVNSKKSGDLSKPFREPINIAKDKLDALKHNIKFNLRPKKSREITFVKREAELINFKPKSFEFFGRSDWDKFWDVIYSPIKDEKGFFKKKRYRSQIEMRSYFHSRYRKTFFRFTLDDWQIFWKIVLE